MPSAWAWWYRTARDGDEAWGSVPMNRQSREGAILEAQRAADPGEGFEIIEAQSSTAAKYATGEFDVVPFVRTRNHERLENGPVQVSQGGEHGKG